VLIRTVSEHGGTPISGVRVQVNDENWQSTGDDGFVAFDGVEPPYDVRVFQTIETDSHRFDDVWALTAQTSRRLTIPVDGSAVPTYHHASITGRVTGLSGSADSQVVVFAHTAPYGGARRLAAADGSFELPSVDWEGPTSQPFTLQAFETDGADPPTHYIGHATASIVVADPDGSGGAVSGAELALVPIDEAHVTGTVTMPENLASGLYPSIELEFGNGSTILLDGDASTRPGSFDFAVPVVDGTRPRIGFLARSGGEQPFGPSSYFERRLTLPADNVDFDLPAPVELLEPGEGAEIGAETLFRWSAVPGDPMYGLHVLCEWDEASIQRQVNYRIIQTAETAARLPVIAELSMMDATCYWSVAWFDGAAFGYDTVVRGDAFGSSWSGERPGLVP
jgi:hypothetical protein